MRDRVPLGRDPRIPRIAISQRLQHGAGAVGLAERDQRVGTKVTGLDVDPRTVVGQRDGVERGECAGGIVQRSEEHTSELQSLMRISYAVFCLKKKKQTKHKST